MGRDEIVPSLLVFGVIPSFRRPHSQSFTQTERYNALKPEREEMELTVAEKRIKRPSHPN